MRRLPTAALLLVVVACGAGVRSLHWPEVFVGDTIVFPVGDAYYHLRRAEFGLAHPGEVLLFDPLVNHPDGAWIPWPPLHTLLLTATAALLGGSKQALEQAAAWYPVAIGAATALPVFGAARVIAGPGTALFAAALVALLPAGAIYSELANVDHHCSVAFFGAVWLWGALLALRTMPAAPRRVAQLAIAIGRLGVVLTWPGSTLYLLLGDGAWVGVAILRGRRDVLRDAALGLVACACITAAVVPQLGPPVGGWYSTLALSFLQPVAMLAIAIVAFVSERLEARAPDRGATRRALRALAASVVVGAALFALPGLLSSLREAAGFVGKDDPWAALNSEQRPLVGMRRAASLLRPLWFYGGFGYVIPLVPIGALLWARDLRHRDASLALAIWTAGFGALALSQLRYGSDFAPSAAVGFALLVVLAGRPFARPSHARIAVAVAALAGAGPLVAQTVLQVRATLAEDRAIAISADPLLTTATGTLVRFAEELRRATPETDGYFDATARPEYGVLSPANVGHLLHYVAHRATPSDNFGPYSGSRHFRVAQRFFHVRSEERAAAIADRLGARYVLTVEYGPAVNDGTTQRLHREDGRELPGQPRWERFRLVTEGPRGGRPLTDLYGGVAMPGVAPYKLFERVAGAQLEIEAEPGALVEAFVDVATPLGRTFRYVARGGAGDDGVAHLRVPYASDATTPVRPGLWRVLAGDATYDVSVPEHAVLRGESVRVGPAETSR
jgi:dolichyl-diphosphooligosaccharide--protein glycosyltransferase